MSAESRIALYGSESFVVVPNTGPLLGCYDHYNDIMTLFTQATHTEPAHDNTRC